MVVVRMVVVLVMTTVAMARVVSAVSAMMIAMATEDTDLEGAVGGINFDRQENLDLGLNDDQIFEDLINIDELKLEDEENW